VELKVSGEILTGTVSIIPGSIRPSPGGQQSAEIYDGNIEKDSIQFKVKSPDGMRVIHFSGSGGARGLRLARKVEARAQRRLSSLAYPASNN